jgi:hypothetical protein
MKYLGKKLVIQASTHADDNVEFCVIDANEAFYLWIAKCKAFFELTKVSLNQLDLVNKLQHIELSIPINLRFYSEGDSGILLTNILTPFDDLDESQFAPQEHSTIGDCLALNNEGLIVLKAFGEYSEGDEYYTYGFNFEDLE